LELNPQAHSDNFSFQNNGIKSAHVGKQWVLWENSGSFGKTMGFF